LFEYFCFVVATAYCKHEPNRTPAALPNWRLKGLLENKFPLIILGVPPNFESLILVTGGDHVLRASDVIAPSNISHPVFVTCAVLAEL